ncbi:MAG: hypothetical protein ICV51_18280, partial [Flavisolibacter sp.]|nr:hypothetical protein [Flavisolibacter sp.]
MYYEQEALLLAQRMHDQDYIGAIMNTFGDIHASLSNWPLAADFYRKSILYAQPIKDQGVLSDAYYGLAKIFKEMGVLDSSIVYAWKAVIAAQEASLLKQVLNTSQF